METFPESPESEASKIIAPIIEEILNSTDRSINEGNEDLEVKTRDFDYPDRDDDESESYERG